MTTYRRNYSQSCRVCEKSPSKASNTEKQQRIGQAVIEKTISAWLNRIVPEGCSKSSKPNRKTAAKNWFDTDDVDDNEKSIGSEATFTESDEEEGIANQGQWRSGPQQGATTKVSSSPTGAASNAQGITVTRQVLVETSPR
jgi:hypothetical protein